MKSPQIIIVSGRSGSGKTSVVNILEDFGFYCLDNLPLPLVEMAIDSLIDNDIDKIALGIDVRTPKADLSSFAAVFERLSGKFAHLTTIYTTAQDHTLVARFGATRRVHPLIANNNAHNLPSAIAKETQLLQTIDELADIKIDTTSLNTHELKEKVRDYLGLANQVVVNILSFGFKYGIPIDADFVFDVRTLPNPHWQEHLHPQTGLDEDIKAFFANYPQVDDMADDIGQFLQKWLPSFVGNNRHSVTVAIGCTGGKHRSVYVSQSVAAKLSQLLPSDMPVVVKHREKRHWH